MLMIYVYVLGNSYNKIYIGSTNNLKRRVFEHKNKECKYTRNWDKILVIACFVILDSIKARKFEFYLKSGSGREFLRKRILSDEAIV